MYSTFDSEPDSKLLPLCSHFIAAHTSPVDMEVEVNTCKHLGGVDCCHGEVAMLQGRGWDHDALWSEGS